jgi:hypothetical protein
MSRTLYASAPTAELPTRHCLDPWFNSMLDSQRGIRPCCWHPPIGRLPVGGSLNDALEGPAMRDIRRQLLTGQLNEHCRACPARSLTTPDLLIKYLLEKLTTQTANPSA